jgi:hypothetical protein
VSHQQDRTIVRRRASRNRRFCGHAPPASLSAGHALQLPGAIPPQRMIAGITEPDAENQDEMGENKDMRRGTGRKASLSGGGE